MLPLPNDILDVGVQYWFFYFALFSSDNLQNQDSFVGRGNCFVFC